MPKENTKQAKQAAGSGDKATAKTDELQAEVPAGKPAENSEPEVTEKMPADKPTDEETTPESPASAEPEQSGKKETPVQLEDEAVKPTEVDPGLAESVPAGKPAETAEPEDRSLPAEVGNINIEPVVEPAERQALKTESEPKTTNPGVLTEPVKSTKPVQDDSRPDPKAAEQTSEQPEAPAQPQIRETKPRSEDLAESSTTGVIKEVPRPLTNEDKDQIFHDRLKELSIKGNTRRSEIHSQNKSKIIEHLKTRGYITNDEVEELCNVKNTTAWQLLQQLENQGQIVQLGQRGPKVRYKLRQGVNL